MGIEDSESSPRPLNIGNPDVRRELRVRGTLRNFWHFSDRARARLRGIYALGSDASFEDFLAARQQSLPDEMRIDFPLKNSEDG